MPRKPNPLPSAEILHQTFVLVGGRLVNKVSRTSRKAGEYADNHYRNGGYHTAFIAGKLQFAHRIIWKMIHGSDPNYIDHIDGNLTNNKPENLREATHSQNMMNAKVHANSASGAKGIHQRKDTGMWRAYISLNRRRAWIGQFPTFEEAKQAADIAREKLHGKFARKL